MTFDAFAPCARCHLSGCPWDRIGGHVICTECAVKLYLGEGEPLRLPPENGIQCLICGGEGIIRYQTPLMQRRRYWEMGLCGRHLRDLIGRCLSQRDFLRLRKALKSYGVPVKQVYLLHGCYYDAGGFALDPLLKGDE